MNLAKQHHEAMVAQGFWENPNLLEKKMLIISELGEAIEAHREGKVCVMNAQERSEIESDSEVAPINFKEDFLEFVKDTYEDELADVVLRIWDYMEYVGKQPHWNFDIIELEENIGANLYHVTRAICNEEFDSAIDALNHLCPNLDWHIKMKMAFNKTRPRRHGKSY